MAGCPRLHIQPVAESNTNQGSLSPESRSQTLFAILLKVVNDVEEYGTFSSMCLSREKP
jgi:hypothetical protein